MRRLQNLLWSVPVTLLFVAGCTAGDPSAGTPPGAGARGDSVSKTDTKIIVTPVKPVRKTLTRWIVLPGQVEAFQETPIFARVPAYVEKLHVDIGDPVAGPEANSAGEILREGQLLAELSVPELDEDVQLKMAMVGQASAEYRQAQAAIKVSRAAETSARAKVEEAGAAVEQSHADYEFASAEFTRTKKLVESGAVTRTLADEKEKLMKGAESQLKHALAKVASAKAAVAEKQAMTEKAEADAETAEKKVVAAEADLARVKAMQGYQQIRAPYTGVVTERNVSKGRLVLPGTDANAKPLLVVAETRVVRVFLDVPESDAPLVVAGNEAVVSIPSVATATHTGRVTRISWTLNPGSRTLRAEVDIENPNGAFRPGMYAKAKLKVAERPEAWTLPKGAVLNADGKSFCQTVNERGLVQRVALETGIRTDTEVEIISGLSGDERVIAANAAAFREGQGVDAR